MGSRYCSCIMWSIFVLVIVGGSLSIVFTQDYHGPQAKFYMQELYIPALNKSSHLSNPNATSLSHNIFIDLKFMASGTLYYDDINITTFYGSNRSFSAGYDVVRGFQQGKKTVQRRAVVEARGLPWEDALRNISGGSTVAMVVELATTKYKVESCDKYDICRLSEPKAVLVAADVRVDASGKDVSNNPLRLL